MPLTKTTNVDEPRLERRNPPEHVASEELKPAQYEAEEIAGRLARRLLKSIRLVESINNFFDGSREIIEYSSLSYENSPTQQYISLGKKEKHSATYNIQLHDKALGCLTLSRNKRFSQAELLHIERLISLLAYAINNALLYEKALQSSMTDKLTGAGNRAALDISMTRELKLARRHRHSISVLLMDVDHFKHINDSVGHQNGDQVLQHIVKIIQSSLRDTDQVFRYGGEEFAILLSKADVNAAHLTAERIRKQIQTTPLSLNEIPCNISVSIGVTEAKDCDSEKAVFNRADQALYSAKQNGRNCVVMAETLTSAATDDAKID